MIKIGATARGYCSGYPDEHARSAALVCGRLAARVLDELDLAELAERGGEVLARDVGAEPLDEEDRVLKHRELDAQLTTSFKATAILSSTKSTTLLLKFRSLLFIGTQKQK